MFLTKNKHISINDLNNFIGQKNHVYSKIVNKMDAKEVSQLLYLFNSKISLQEILVEQMKSVISSINKKHDIHFECFK